MSDDADTLPPPAPVTFYSVTTDAAGVVTGYGHSNVAPPAATAASAEVYAAVVARGGLARFDGTTVTDYTPPTPPAPQPYLTGQDVIDGLSPAQAKAADPRDIVRIQFARTAAEVKSKISRVAKANGITADALLAQATPTGT